MLEHFTQESRRRDSTPTLHLSCNPLCSVGKELTRSLLRANRCKLDLNAMCLHPSDSAVYSSSTIPARARLKSDNQRLLQLLKAGGVCHHWFDKGRGS